MLQKRGCVTDDKNIGSTEKIIIFLVERGEG
jgi:hypothetical protein